MSNKQRQKLAEKRRAEQQATEQRRRRRTLLMLIVGVFLFGAILALAVFVATQEGEPQAPSSSTASNQRLLQGLEQRQLTLGDPRAKVKIVEFADLSCPYCAVLADQGLRQLIAGPVRRGQVQLEFKPWVVVPGSEISAAAVYAAAEQGRGWQMIKNIYGQQEELLKQEITIERLEEIAQQSGVPDLQRWRQDSDPQRWQQQLTAIDLQADELGFSGTPALAFSANGAALQATELGYQASRPDFRELIANAK